MALTPRLLGGEILGGYLFFSGGYFLKYFLYNLKENILINRYM